LPADERAVYRSRARRSVRDPPTRHTLIAKLPATRNTAVMQIVRPTKTFVDMSGGATTGAR